MTPQRNAAARGWQALAAHLAYGGELKETVRRSSAQRANAGEPQPAAYAGLRTAPVNGVLARVLTVLFR